MREKKESTAGFEPATFHSTANYLPPRVESHVYHACIATTNLDFDDLIVAGLVHARSLHQLFTSQQWSPD